MYGTAPPPSMYGSFRAPFPGDEYLSRAPSWAGSLYAASSVPVSPPLSAIASSYGAFPFESYGAPPMPPMPGVMARPPLGTSMFGPQPIPTMYSLDAGFNGMVFLAVNIRYRGRQSLLLSESARVALPAEGMIQDVWLSLLSDPSTAHLNRYSRRLTGRVEAKDPLHETSMSLRLDDYLDILRGSPMDTLIFVVDPSPIGQVLEAGASALANIADAVTGNSRSVQIGRGRYNRYDTSGAYSDYGRVSYNGYRRRRTAYNV
jgi:hypothetical protein